MTFTNQDDLSEQMEPVWKGFAKYNNLTAEQLDAADMVALGRFICGLNSSEIEQLDGDAFTCVLHTELTCDFIYVTTSACEIHKLVHIRLDCLTNPHKSTKATSDCITSFIQEKREHNVKYSGISTKHCRLHLKSVFVLMQLK